MAYDYYCTYCGKELNQNIIYFNMFPTLTGNKSSQFDILRFRMTKAELEKLVLSGKKDGNGYYHCRLSFAEVMSYIGNVNNINSQEVAGITLQDIDDYITEEYVVAEETAYDDQNFTNSLFGESDPIKNAVKEDPVPVKTEEKVYAKGIIALETLIEKNENILNTRVKLQEEFRTLRGVFSLGETCEFEIQLNFEEDNDGKPVLVGYTANAGSPKRLVIVDDRLCPYCGVEVIEHAGTAEHKTITFIGDQKAGKTSTIIALTHYALHAAADGALPSDTWRDCAPVGGIDTIELVSKDPAQQHDLKMYGYGVAPAKTHNMNRGDAYAVSFRIKNAYQNKYFLLTLTDLPGELFDNTTGRMRTEDILQTFPIALACDLFVLCFDTRTAKGDKAAEMVRKAGNWTNDIQSVRQSYNQSNGRDKGLMEKIKKGEGAKALSAPVMILYTKCTDLEEPDNNPLPMSKADAFNRIARTNMHDKERRTIDASNVYRNLGVQLAKFDKVAGAYQARLRCSPFGFAAPSEIYINEHPEEFEFAIDEYGEKYPVLPHPQPKHIDMLMRWLLMVSGCVPVPAKYRPYADPAATEEYTYQTKYFFSGTQYRMLNPGSYASGEKDADLHEALARCYMFENPGKHDSALLSDYNNWALLAKDRLAASFQRN